MTSLLAIDQGRITTSRLFLKLLALIYLAAFYSLTGQIAGLAGPQGILPFQELLEASHAQQGPWAWLWLPSLFWLDAGDLALSAAAWAGCALSLLLLLGQAQRLALILLFVLYLSLVQAGQLFLNFQWDYLLLEAGFLAIFLVNGPSRLVVLLFHFLLFRLRFLSGLAKLLSGDPSWQHLSALNHYFQTQPLPHIGSWYAQQLPDWLLRAGTGATLLLELVVPLFIFLPRPFRLFAAFSTILLQLLIIATSNHNFFNLLTIALCLFLLDDRLLGKTVSAEPKPAGAGSALITGLAGLLVFTAGGTAAVRLLAGPLPQPVERALDLAQAYGLGNSYHVFPVIQTERQELEIQGSQDGTHWQSYGFHYKPGPLDQAPRIAIPFHPRLDWMLWFVPTQGPEMLYWFDRLMLGLWRNETAISGLLQQNPFAGQAPKYLRVLAWRYRFSTPGERAQSGHWWAREYLGEFPQAAPRRP